MQSDYSQNSSLGRITSGVQIDASILSVIDYLKICMPIFQEKCRGEVSTNEDILNEKLSIILLRNIGHRPYFFKPEKLQHYNRGTSPRTDIGVLSQEEIFSVNGNSYGENEAFYEIECKRLPSPSASEPRQYVKGRLRKCGAIERYKECIHGSNVTYASIIAYQQSGSFTGHLATINKWIDDEANGADVLWGAKDKLSFESSINSQCNVYQSINGRSHSTNDIHLLHLWVNLMIEVPSIN